MNQKRRRLTDTENKLVVTSGKRKAGRGQGAWDKIGVWDSETQTITDKIDKQQGCTYSTGKYNHYFVITLDGV